MTPQNRLADLIHTACVLEARTRKPGNVHPGAAFEDLCYEDFVLAARAVAEVLPAASEIGVGAAILQAVRRTRELAARPTNPNLGIILLLAPLAAVPAEISLKEGIRPVLDGLTIEDARQVYEAIGLANPGGMGKVKEADVTETPAISLLDAMRLAADRDSIASEYVTGFQIVLETGVPFLEAWFRGEGEAPDEPRASSGPYATSDSVVFLAPSAPALGGEGPGVRGPARPPITPYLPPVTPPVLPNWETAIVHLQLTLMSQFPDTLIARKCGRELAAESATRAQGVLDAGGLQTEPGRLMLRQFDAWLRADGHRRNPGTTADLIAASLFAAARDGMIDLSFDVRDV